MRKSLLLFIAMLCFIGMASGHSLSAPTNAGHDTEATIHEPSASIQPSWSNDILREGMYNVMVSPDIMGGTVTVDPMMASAGETITVMAMPDEGYYLMSIQYTDMYGTYDIDQAMSQFTMPESDVTVTAYFEYQGGGGGGGGGGYNPPIMQCDIYVNAYIEDPELTGYVFISWTDPSWGGDSYSVYIAEDPYSGNTELIDNIIDTHYTYNMSERPSGIYYFGVSSDRCPDQTFWTTEGIIWERKYNIAVENIEHGTLSTDKAQAVEGEMVSVFTTPEDGYKLGDIHYIEEGSQLPTSIDTISRNFTMPASNITISGMFIPKTYQISTSYTEHGTISTDWTEAIMGEQIHVNAQPDPGYELTELYYYSDVAGFEHGFIDLVTMEFVMPPANVTIHAIFTPITYHIAVLDSYGGSITADRMEATINDVIHVTAEANSGFELTDLYYYYGDTQYPIDLITMEFEMPASDVTITGVFSPILYNITIDGNITGGTVSVSQETAFAGDIITVTATPDPEYNLMYVQYYDMDGNYYDIDMEMMNFTMPQFDVTVIAYFEYQEIGGGGGGEGGGGGDDPCPFPPCDPEDPPYNPEDPPINPPMMSHYIDVSWSGDGNLSASTTEATSGEYITIIANAYEGYELTTLYYTDCNGGPYDILGDYGFTMPDCDVTVYGEFTPIAYQISIITPEHGTLSVDKTEATMGETVHITAQPNTGYELAQIDINSNSGQIYTGTNLEFEMPASDVTITATFTPKTYNITVSPSEHGTLQAPSQALYGETITVDTIPEAGYKLSLLYYSTSESGQIDIKSTCSFAMPANDVMIHGEFTPIYYNVNIDTPEHGTLSANPTKAIAGTTITVTATANDGYELVSLRYTDSEGEHDILSTKSFTMPTCNVTVCGTFDPIEYDVNVSNPEHGSLSASPSQATVGQTITVTATADNGYELTGLYYVMSGSTSQNSISLSDKSFTMPASDVTVYAEYTKTYNVTVSTPEHGTLSANPTQAIAGTTITVTATANDGYELASLHYTDSEGEHDILSTKSFTMPNCDVTVYAVYSPIKYNVNISTPEHGTLSVDKTQAIEGDTITVTATAESGYGLADLYYIKDGSTTRNDIDTTKTFIMPASNVTVYASYAKMYNVTVSTPEHGSLSASHTEAIAGTPITVTVTPNEGYALGNLYYTASDSNDTTYYIDYLSHTFNMPEFDVTISANFANETIEVSAELNDSTAHISWTDDVANYNDSITYTLKLEGEETFTLESNLQGLEYTDTTIYSRNSGTYSYSIKRVGSSNSYSSNTIELPASTISASATMNENHVNIQWNDSYASYCQQTYTLFISSDGGTTNSILSTDVTGSEFNDYGIFDRPSGTYVYGIQRANDPIVWTNSIITIQYLIEVSASYDSAVGNVRVHLVDNANYSPKTYTLHRKYLEEQVQKQVESGLEGPDCYDNTLVYEPTGTYLYGISRDSSPVIYWSDDAIYHILHNFSISTVAEHGTMSAPTEAPAGELVSVELTPDTGYELDSLYFRYSAGTRDIDSSYTFRMPASDITIYGIFGRLPFLVQAVENDSDNVGIDWWPNSSGENTAQSYNIYRRDTLRNISPEFLGSSESTHFNDATWGEVNYGIRQWGVEPIYGDGQKGDIVWNETGKGIIKSWSNSLEKNMSTDLTITVTDRFSGDPIDGAHISLRNELEKGYSYSGTTTADGVCSWNDIRSGYYDCDVWANSGYYSRELYINICPSQNHYNIELQPRGVIVPSNLFVSKTGWAMWNETGDGSIRLRVDDGAWIYVGHYRHQIDVSNMAEGETHTVQVAGVKNGQPVAIESYEWTYSSCSNYEGMTNLTATYSDRTTLNWTMPSGSNIIGTMVWRGSELLTYTPYIINSYVDNSSLNANGNIEYSVRVVYGDSYAPYTGDYYSMSCKQSVKSEFAHHWQADTTQFESKMTVIGNVSINDTTRYYMHNDRYDYMKYYEVGAFCGDECRGSGRTSGTTYTFPIYGEPGDDITFRIFSHRNNEEEEGLSCESIKHVTDTVGTYSDPCIFDFYNAQTQCAQLGTGNNWYSSYVKIDGVAGLDTIKAGLSTSGNMIKSQTQYTLYTDGIWFGTLQEANNEQMYIINSNADTSLCITGHIERPSKHPITLHHNWNWIGYPVNRNLSTSYALNNVTSSSEDIIKSQSAYSTYYEGYGWFGALNVMEPGRGYMLKQQQEETQTFCYPTVGRSSDEDMKANITSDNNYWRPKAQDFATNMNLTCVISIDGEIQRSESLEVAALCNGEVRGSARPMYFEPLDEYVVMLTIHGNEGDIITFKLYDVENGFEYESNAKEALTYSDNNVIGKLSNPFVLHFGNANGIGESSIESISLYPNPVNRGSVITLTDICDKVEIFNTIGIKVAEYQNTDKLSSIEVVGSYIIKITNNDNISYSKIVVK